MVNRLFILILLIFSACSENTNLERMAHEQRSFEDMGCHHNECANVVLEYPFFTDNNMTASILNEYIEQQLVMMFGLKSSDEVQSITTVSQKFLDSFLELAKSQEAKQSWEIDINAEVTFQNSELLSVRFDAYSNTGGAHPNLFRQYVNIHKTEGTLLRNDELIKDNEGLLRLTENAFKEYHEVNEDTDLENDERFFLKHDSEFFLPVAIGLEEDELVLYYNPYEIAPYAIGATILRFHRDEVKNLINELAFDQ